MLPLIGLWLISNWPKLIGNLTGLKSNSNKFLEMSILKVDPFGLNNIDTSPTSLFLDRSMVSKLISP
ncbi:hypothetical protein GIB67_003221, partial [Kingdonia uniflora]